MNLMAYSQSSLTPSQSQSSSCTAGSARKGKCNNAKLVSRFFTKISVDSNEFKCQICGLIRKQPPLAGHGNLMNHLNSHHADEVEHAQVTNQPTMEAYVSVKASNVFGWMRDIPFEWTLSGEANVYSKLSPMDPRTIKNYMHKVGAEIERIVSTSIIRNKNGLVVPLVMLFDMWDDGSGTKQLGVYLCYPGSSYVFLTMLYAPY